MIQWLFLFLLQSAHAEYRAFELVITPANGGSEVVVISTLDPNQYRDYNPTHPQDKIIYRDTWMCYGNTSHFTPICPKPEGRQRSG